MILRGEQFDPLLCASAAAGRLDAALELAAYAVYESPSRDATPSPGAFLALLQVGPTGSAH